MAISDELSLDRVTRCCSRRGGWWTRAASAHGSGRELADFDRISEDVFTLDGLQAEWAPRPGTHTRDRSAADLAACVRTADGRKLLIMVEVMYTDDFSPAPLDPRRYDLAVVGLTPEAVVDLHTGRGTQFLRSVLLTAAVQRSGAVDEVLSVVLGRDDDEHAREVVRRVGAAVPSVPVGYWSITAFADAAARRPELDEWAEALRGRYVPEG